ncbi:MAG: MogA/MoaB family molybdenum cofactor biosynthesis protein [Microbacteriaceae bacterium]|nr:MogA/MoaB family molybdenum cofactor biosynthesis protein [Microbacteriaceae bacterium]
MTLHDSARPRTARVVTVSDRAAAGEYADRSGPAAAEALAGHGIRVDGVDVVPDGDDSVRAAIEAAIGDGVDLVVTTGGTGIGPRDRTPEATATLLAVRLEGVEQAMRAAGLPQVPTAVLSRGLVGLTSRGPDAVLVVNAPGSVGGVRDAVAVVGPLVGHVLGQARGDDPGH